jgi:flagella basal body P-ring formation protein FlgA
VVERRSKSEAGQDPAPRDRAIGMQVRRSVRAGQALRMPDLAKADLVQRDQNVTLIYETNGLYLTMRGKATDAGSEGDTVSVMNLQSKRTVQGTVTGPGQVTMSVVAPRLTASLPQDEPATDATTTE